jgi:hypothetical protein
LISLRRARVDQIERVRPGVQFLQVELDGQHADAVVYTDLTGECSPGDQVLLNTTAVELGLGTGGRHLVVANLSHPEHESRGPGHVMKLRYTPLQLRVLAGGEERSPLREALQEGASLEGMPVIVLPLHSMLAPAAVAYARAAAGAPLSYLMTDGAALPITLSETVAQLRHAELLAATVTSGHAFGGDAEAVSLYDGLLLAAELSQGGAVAVGPGPGIVGTDTTFGTTALEQGQVVNAVASLHGQCIVALRVSSADERPRHRGISHHTVTSLTIAALAPAWVAIPEGYPEILAEARAKLLAERPDGHPGLTADHLRLADASGVRDWLKACELWPTTMGRTPDDDPVFFETAAAAGMVAGGLVADHAPP